MKYLKKIIILWLVAILIITTIYIFFMYFIMENKKSGEVIFVDNCVPHPLKNFEDPLNVF